MDRGGKYGTWSEGYIWEVLPDPMCSCVCVIQRAREEPPEAEVSRAYCGRSEKEINVFSLHLCIYKYKCVLMHTRICLLSLCV